MGKSLSLRDSPVKRRKAFTHSNSYQAPASESFACISGGRVGAQGSSNCGSESEQSDDRERNEDQAEFRFPLPLHHTPLITAISPRWPRKHLNLGRRVSRSYCRK